MWSHPLDNNAEVASLLVDDGNGAYVLMISRTLKYELVDRFQRSTQDPSHPEATQSTRPRYLTVAERRKLMNQEKTTKYKRHIYPDVAVGNVVRVRGRVKEWSRRNGEVIRELVVDQEGSIGQSFLRDSIPCLTLDTRSSDTMGRVHTLRRRRSAKEGNIQRSLRTEAIREYAR